MTRSNALRVRAGSLAVAVVAGGVLIATDPSTVPAGAAGEDRLTESAVTLAWSDGVTGADPDDVVEERDPEHFMYDDFDGLEVTVSQTEDIRAQALEVTWSGWQPTPGSLGKLPSNYLQFMQCWGDDNAGPLPENCVWGAQLMPDIGTGLGTRSRAVAPDDPLIGEIPDSYTDPASGQLTVPFQGVSGEPVWDGGGFPFDRWTTNEAQGLRTDGGGNGEGVLSVHDAVDAPHLGCGAPVESADGSVDGRDCWLVVVPHGVHRLDGTPAEGGGGRLDADGTPLTPTLWNQRLQFRLDFAPVAGTCPTNAAQRPTVGSEFISGAIRSWQPALCADDGSSYAYLPAADAEGRRQVSLTDPLAPGLAFTYAPVTGDTEVVHAPVAVSGVAIAFNIEEPDGTIIRDLELTPRLVAKLLTQSYRYDVPGGSEGFAGAAAEQLPDWLDLDHECHKLDSPPANPCHVSQDPEFRELNPDVPRMSTGSNPLRVSGDPADALREVWRWIQADADAVAWLSGEPDEFGMRVNPAYEYLAEPPAPDTIPRDVGSCYDNPNDSQAKPEFCTLQLLTSTGSFTESAEEARAGRSGAEIGWDTQATNPSGGPGWWAEADPQKPGSRWQLALTDTASAAQYSLPVASLSNAAGEFVQPDAAGLAAGVEAMVPTDVDGVVAIDPAAESGTAYPLTMVTYAAVRAEQEDDALADYAALLTYAAGPGQSPGVAAGELPPGYAPLNDAMRAQTLAAAEKLLEVDEPDGPPDFEPNGDDPGGDESGDESGDDPPGGDESGGDTSGAETGTDQSVAAEAGTDAPPPAGTPLQPSGSLVGADTGLGPNDDPALPADGPPDGTEAGLPPGTDGGDAVAMATPGEPVGPMQYALLVVLIAGLVGAVAGPAILRLAPRKQAAVS